MSDFAQTGLICTLQRLNETHLAGVEREMVTISQTKPVALVLPCHAAELERPALAHIVSELREAHFLQEIVVSMNGLDRSAFEDARDYFRPLPQRVRILWNDGPKLGELFSKWNACAGKGLNVWAAWGLICLEGTVEWIVAQDCDVASFRKENLARLCFACAHPQLGYAFAKMYYSRVTDRLYGRVSRLFLAPLLHALVRMSGHDPLLDFLLSFRYPLAGECVLRRDLAEQLSLDSGWGLEIGMLGELFRKVDPRRMCQVDGGTGYDHKHQAVGEGSGLTMMCGQIAMALFEQLREEGIEVDEAFRSALVATYEREANLALRRSANLALINGLPFDEPAERAIVDAFIRELQAGSGSRPNTLPSWSSLRRSDPAFVTRFFEAVQEI